MYEEIRQTRFWVQMSTLLVLPGPCGPLAAASVVALAVVPPGETKEAVSRSGDHLRTPTVSTTPATTVSMDTPRVLTWPARCCLALMERVLTVHGDVLHPMAKAVD